MYFSLRIGSRIIARVMIKILLLYLFIRILSKIINSLNKQLHFGACSISQTLFLCAWSVLFSVLCCGVYMLAYYIS